jgi:putative flippase GtrA
MIIVFVLGLLGLLGLSLGPVESLSFAIVIGVSVDYLVHFAYAFKHSLMAEQYYKSRAVLMARFGSTVASGLTTLCAVLPLLAANIVPLRIFGVCREGPSRWRSLTPLKGQRSCPALSQVIFTIVALVSLFCATLLFNALLMVTGPGIRMSVHSLPSGSSLPPVAFSRTLAPTNEDGARAQPPLSPREHCRPGVLVAFGGKQPSANGTNRSEATTVSTSTASDRGVFRGHMANGVIGAIKV